MQLSSRRCASARGRGTASVTEPHNDKLPQRQHHDDAGCDLRVARSGFISPCTTMMVPTGYSPHDGDIPEGSVGLVFARSSLHKRGLSLANGVGVIDSGYRGEVLLAVRNDVNVPVTVNEGERIAQIVVVPLDLSSNLYNNNNNTRSRGQGGFGSTGRN